MTPDLRSASRLLRSVLRRRPGLLTAATVSGVLWMSPTAVMPLVIGRAIDTGIGTGDGAALLRWVLVVVLLGVVQAVGAGVLAWTAHTLWLHGTATTQRMVLRHVTRLGITLPRTVRAGEVVTISSSDVYQVGTLFEVLGRAAGSVVSFLAVTGVVLVVSPLLGLVVLVGVPLATVGIAPLLRPLRRREETQRQRLGEIGAQACDIVSGLRILRGIGGESRFHARFVESSHRVRDAGMSVGRVVAWLSGAEILLPGLVTVLVTWIGARLALAGTITVGELVAFYGVSAFLVIPVRTATEAAEALGSALVAAERIRLFLRVTPEPAPPPDPCALPPGPLSLRDEISGVEVATAELTVVATSEAALADRLAGHDHEAPAFAGGVPLSRVDPDELRRRIVLAHDQDLLFSGPPRVELDIGSAVDLDEALHAADATDVLAELGPEAVLDERGRSLSGGQRQRLVLARALCSDADVLVLDEPTSAVDAHTEERIVRRVRELRHGRTTVVLTRSPLWTRVADRVVAGEPV